jgi:hypothetical protein
MLAVILGLLLILAGFMRLSVAGASSAGAAQYTIGIVEARMSPEFRAWATCRWRKAKRGYYRCDVTVASPDDGFHYGRAVVRERHQRYHLTYLSIDR